MKRIADALDDEIIPDYLKKIFQDGTIESKTIFEVLFEIMMGFFQMLSNDKEKALKFLEIIPRIYLNMEDILLESGEIDNDHYNSIRAKLKELDEIDVERTREICQSYLISIQKKFSIDSIAGNLLIFREKFTEILDLTFHTPLKDYEEKITSFLIDLIENKQKLTFENYFFDWVLKFGYVIESHIKEFLKFLVKADCIRDKKEYDRIIAKNRTIGKLLKLLETDSKLASYRNAIFHADFNLDYQIDYNQRKIIFYNFDGSQDILSIEEFVGNFFYIMRLIKTQQICIVLYFQRIFQPELEKEFNELVVSLKNQTEDLNIPREIFSIEALEDLKKKFKEQMFGITSLGSKDKNLE